MLHRLLLFGLALFGLINIALGKQPNIVFIISDDQDYRLGSLNYMSNVQKHIIGKGIEVKNHFGTVALCCPARATLLRGQAAHNTNVTHVGGPAGGWPKFQATGEHNYYLPHWLKDAGYTSAYFGKFMNGYGMHNYQNQPSGWDHTDILVGPHIYDFNTPVFSRNGECPRHCKEWHQTDVLRCKALDRLEWMVNQDKPFYLEIAPASPHVKPGGHPTVPLSRHMNHFPGVSAPDNVPNWNPDDEFQHGKPTWIGQLDKMNKKVIHWGHESYRARMQGLQGVDELVGDVVAFLAKKGILDDTYIIYTTDNGFHLGQHRISGGKGTPYIEDVNLPLAVRGPGIPHGHAHKIPSSHIDMAPTILEIAGVPKKDWPPFFDGRSLLQEWKTLKVPEEDDGMSREVLNVEYWGTTTAPAGPFTKHYGQNTFKSLRIVSKEGGWLFNRWCTSNETELYNTTADPYELTNLAINPSDKHKKVMDRLSGLLLVTKSCGQDSCRKPWDVLSNEFRGVNGEFKNLTQALDPKYDSFFASLPAFGFQHCARVQRVENEGPYLPPSSSELGRQYRAMEEADADAVHWATNGTLWVEEEKFYGNLTQRYTCPDWSKCEELTPEEIGWPTVECRSEEDCEWLYDD